MTTFIDTVILLTATVVQLNLHFPFVWGIAFGLIIVMFVAQYAKVRR